MFLCLIHNILSSDHYHLIWKYPVVVHSNENCLCLCKPVMTILCAPTAYLKQVKNTNNLDIIIIVCIVTKKLKKCGQGLFKREWNENARVLLAGKSLGSTRSGMYVMW